MSKLPMGFISAFCLLFLPMTAYAVDGVTLISQASILAGGGFPYTITQPGSYRLSSNLVVPSYSDGIHIASSSVSLDLNGFTISAGTNSGNAISDVNVAHTGISVRNGFITHASLYEIGVSLPQCMACDIEQLRVSSGGNGIVVGSTALVVGNIVTPFGSTTNGYGIVTGPDSTVSGNSVSHVLQGITVGVHSTVTGNTASDEADEGIYANCPSNIVGNTAIGNSSGNIVQFGSGCTLFNNNAP